MVTTTETATHRADQWSVHSNGQGRVRLELQNPGQPDTRVTLSVAQALSLMDALGRACKKARAETQEG